MLTYEKIGPPEKALSQPFARHDMSELLQLPAIDEPISKNINAIRKIFEESDSARESFANTIVFLLSNKLLSGSNLELLYQWISEHLEIEALAQFLRSGECKAEAVIEELFKLAIDSDNIRLTKRLLAVGIDIRKNYFPTDHHFQLMGTPLWRACMHGNSRLTRVLLEYMRHTYDLPENYYHPLVSEVFIGLSANNAEDGYELLQILFDLGATAETGELHRALIESIAIGSVNMVDLLLKAGAHPQKTPSVKDPPVFSILRALRHGVETDTVIEMIVLLLDAGACIKSLSLSGRSLFDEALMQGNIDLIRFLYVRGARLTKNGIQGPLKGLPRDLHHTAVDFLLTTMTEVTAIYIEVVVRSSDIRILKETMLSSKPGLPRSMRQGVALAIAISLDKHEFIDYLFDLGAVLPALWFSSYTREAILHLCYSGNLSTLEKVLEKHVQDIDEINNLLRDSLTDAIDGGSVAIIKLIFSLGLDPEKVTMSLIEKSLEQKNSKVAKVLVAAGVPVQTWANATFTAYNSIEININFPEFQGYISVLPKAVELGDHELVQSILNTGADVDACDENGRTALAVAVRMKDEEMLRTLIENNADINNPVAKIFGDSALHAAMQMRNLRLVQYLLANGADPNQEDVLDEAVLGDVQLLAELLTSGTFNPRKWKRGGSRALCQAIALRDIQKIELLLINNANPNVFVRDIPSIILTNLDSNIMSNISNLPTSNAAKGSAEQELRGISALGAAIILDTSANLDILQAILNQKVNLNGPALGYCGLYSQDCSAKLSPLLTAILRGNAAVVNKIVAAGAEINPILFPSVMYTPLQFAARLGQLDMVCFLLRLGAKVNAPGVKDFGARAIQCAAMSGSIDIAKLLISEGADVNSSSPGYGGRTALEGAAENGRIDMLQLLLESGALITGDGNRQYENSIGIAEAMGHIAAARLLQQHRMFSDIVDISMLDNTE